MSFSQDIKREILDDKPGQKRLAAAQAYGLLLFARAFGGKAVTIVAESEEIAALAGRHITALIGKGAALEYGWERKSGRKLCALSLPRKEDRLRLLERFGHKSGINRALLQSAEDVGTFLSGVFLSCGNVTDPEKGYHLEFVVKDETLARELEELLEGAIAGVRRTSRRGGFIVYYKECQPIEDVLTLMGASKSSLAMIDVEMIKQVRNRANRVTNCETANIDKTVGAAQAQMEDIRLIESGPGLGSLPEDLRAAALLRLDNPEASLRELADMMPMPVSRSGMHRRLDKLQRLAEGLRAGNRGKG